MVDGVTDDVRAWHRFTRFRENFGPAVQDGSIGCFAAVVERAIRRILRVGTVGVRLLVLLQMIPLGEEDTAVTINRRRKIPGWRMVQQLEIACYRIQTPQSRVCWRRFVLIQLWVQVHLPVTWPIRGKNDAVIRAVNRADVVEILWLVGHFGDDRRVVQSQPSNFV